MKIPEKAPSWEEVLRKPITPDLALKVADLVKKANSEYMYWDQVKYQPLPEGVDPDLAWGMVKLSRIMQYRALPLADPSGRHFVYWLPDCVLKEFHFIDRQAGGSILVDDTSVHSDEKRRYMIRSLVDEAISSSQIEGAATTRVIAREMLRTGRKPRDRSEQMIYNNYLSMQFLKKRLTEPLTIELIQEIHVTMTADTLEDPSWAGRLRSPDDEEIHILDADGQRVLHVPPKADDVPALMTRLCDYANSDVEAEFMNPVVRGILLHFWLAYVHPFMDGNGRTARALLYWYMLKHRYWLFEYLSISTAILSARAQYYRSFLYSETDDNDATYFINYNLKAIHDSIEKLNEYLERKQREKRRAFRFATKYPALNMRQRSLLASAIEKPSDIFTIEAHANVHGVTYQTARTDLLDLRDMGLLEMRKEGKKFVFTAPPDLAKRLES
ncbi:MAG: Fic family protein [Chloroflexota bacterium]